MTREELTARLRKLTGKTTTDIESLDERVDALEAGAGGGGVEIKTLDVTVRLDSGPGGSSNYTGFITSTLPTGIEDEIEEILKVENLTTENEMTNKQILPIYTFSASDFKFQNSFTYQKIDNLTAEYASIMPLGLVFNYTATVLDGPYLTRTLRITYV